jgi:hypothetical protein
LLVRSLHLAAAGPDRRPISEVYARAGLLFGALGPQIGDFTAPPRDQLVPLWIPAVSDDSLLAKGEFMLSVDECSRSAALDRREAPRAEDPIAPNRGEFLRSDSSAHFTCELFLDDAAFPLPACAQRHQDNANEGKKQQQQILNTC